MTLRLVRSRSEMEGRYTESWALVDSEDELEPLPDGEELATFGRPAPRFDGLVRASGAARYTVDVVLPGMLHGAVLRSPHAHARVVGLDVEAARAVDGVRTVIGPDETLANPDSEPGFVAGGSVLSAEVEYAGQAIAAVAADTAEAAAAGLNALAPVYEQLAVNADFDAALNELRFTEDPIERRRGDSERALAEADVRVELTVETPAHLQSALETHAAVADWRPDGLTLWLSTQAIFAAREQIARSLGLEPDRVRDRRVRRRWLRSQDRPGCRGHSRGRAFATQRPARSRRHRPPRRAPRRRPPPGDKADGSPRWKHDGTLAAVEVDAVVATGAEREADLVHHETGSGTCGTPVPMRERDRDGIPAPGEFAGAERLPRPRVMEGTTVLEQAVDVLALELGRDPLELRRLLHTDVDQESGQPYWGKRLLQCYDRAAELSGWAQRDRLLEPQADGLLRGMGCASQIWWGGGGPPAQSTVRISADGIATVITGIQDIGTGTLTTAQIVAAEELGLPRNSVRVLGGDTGRGVYAPISGGSMTTPSVMPAVRAAAGKARKLLLQLAGDVLEIAADDLLVAGGRIRSRDGAVDIAVTEVTGKLGQASIETTGARARTPTAWRFRRSAARLPRLWSIPGSRARRRADLGRARRRSHRQPARSLEPGRGGILQGLGYALSEELVVDPTTGVPVNATLDDYKLPTIADVPEITIDFVDLRDDAVPNTGARGLGEPPIIPTAAAIANAFVHATGRRAKALPLTRARVLEALR